MPHLVHQYGITIAENVRHVVFAGEDEVVFTNARGDVLRLHLGLPAAQPELLIPANQVLSPVAQSLRVNEVQPAAGAYPRLAISRQMNTVVVNTHDLIFVACPLSGAELPQKLPGGAWGDYYPRMEFSPDQKKFSALADYHLVYDVETWRSFRSEVDSCGWHPRRPMQLCLDSSGEIYWADWSHGIEPIVSSVGTIGLRNGWNQARGLTILGDGDRFVVAFHPPRLEVWQIEPLRLLDSLRPNNGEISECRLSPDGRWLVVFAERGLQVWDTSRELELSQLFPGFSELHFDFASRGGRFVTSGRLSEGENPYPISLESGQPRAGGLISFWEILE